MQLVTLGPSSGAYVCEVTLMHLNASDYKRALGSRVRQTLLLHQPRQPALSTHNPVYSQATYPSRFSFKKKKPPPTSLKLPNNLFSSIRSSLSPSHNQHIRLSGRHRFLPLQRSKPPPSLMFQQVHSQPPKLGSH